MLLNMFIKQLYRDQGLSIEADDVYRFANRSKKEAIAKVISSRPQITTAVKAVYS